MSLKNNIKLVLATLNKAIQQAPLDKQPFLTHRIIKINQKYAKLNPDQNEASYLKQLQFNLNFVKLSFPYLDYTPPKEQNSQQNQPQQQVNEINQERAKQEFIQLEDKQKVLKFVQQTGKVLKGVRQEVQFSNWGTGNVDPQDLKRHKELLKRQYFAGQFWKDKQKPKSPSAQYLMDIMQNSPEIRNEKVQLNAEEQPAAFVKDPDQNWQKVKR